ncbi:hypothetical protein E2P69_04680 [Xanthomonas perforans]|nr:hypothetical protein EII94_11645 [Xanthomonas perforans]TQT64126.1 hypothetical protein EIJ73_06245 [Xanthomonas perforans]TVS48232.1 hypothetical protein E2P66_19715 [Xanthomonas perforans]TVS58298.1 hypothetical protein E2P69_04680 [Xanthomonas perforans]
MVPGNRVIECKRSSTGGTGTLRNARDPGSCPDQPASVRFNVDDIERTHGTCAESSSALHVAATTTARALQCRHPHPCRMPWP